MAEQQPQAQGMVARCNQAVEQLQLAEQKLRRHSAHISTLEAALDAARCKSVKCFR